MLVGPPVAAQSDDVAQAKALAVQGMREFQLGNYADSLDLLQKAFKIKPVPALLFNVAQCHRLLGHLEQARRVYRAYIDAAPATDATVATARAKIAEIDVALKAQASVQNSQPQVLAQDKLPQGPAAPAEPPVLVVNAPAPQAAAAPAPVAPPAASPPATPPVVVAAAAPPPPKIRVVPAEEPPQAPAPAAATGAAGAPPPPASSGSTWPYWAGAGAVVVGGAVVAALLLGGKKSTPEQSAVFDAR